MPSEILESFAALCRDRGQEVAVAAPSEGRVLTFTALREEARAFHRVLTGAALARGDTLLWLGGNHSGLLATFLACLELGVVLLPIDGEVPLAEAELLMEEYRAAAAVARRPLGLARTGEPVSLGGGLLLHPAAQRRAPRDFADAVLLKLTSGSSARPRAVLCAEDNLVADGRQVAEAMGIGPRDINWGAIPLAHSYALGNLVLPLLLQGTRLAFRESFAPHRFAADLEATRASVFPGVPFEFDHLLRALPAGPLPGSLRLLVSAGAPLEAATAFAFRERFGAKIHSFYGSSESGGIAYDDADDLGDPLPVGHPLPGTTVTLEPWEGAEEGEGRVFVRGRAVARGFARDEARGWSRFTRGGFLTGDLARHDAIGRLVLTGRLSSFVNVAGRKVNPAEVERHLRAHPGVEQVKVLGLPDEARGEKLVACVVGAAGGGPGAAVLREHLSRHLAAYKIPRDFVFLAALPIDGRGKLDRGKLEAAVRGGAGRD